MDGKFLSLARPENENLMTYRKTKEDFETVLAEDFEPFWYGKAINTLRKKGLLVL